MSESGPFVNLQKKEPGRWGQGLATEKMRECMWVLCRMRHSNHNVECRTFPDHPAHLPIDLLRPYPADGMTVWIVSSAVGNVKNDEPG
jgi:hypothetical protein